MKKIFLVIGGYLVIGGVMMFLGRAENKWKNPLNYLTVLFWPFYAREIITTRLRGG